MKGYVHRGVVQKNGVVDTLQSINDALALRVSPEDDRFHLTGPEIGNFEWWYFDVLDANSGCALKIVAHLGTDPLRRRFFPQVTVSVRTPAKKYSFVKHYSLEDFSASSAFCDVRIQEDFHAQSRDEDERYHLEASIDRFRCKFTFVREIEGWKPLGNSVRVERKGRRGTFCWIIPVPKARVMGEFSLGNERYVLDEAFGYHDHNYWEAGPGKKLYMDDVLSHWHWGRFLSRDDTIVFMDTYLKKAPIRSIMIGRGDKIIHSSNNLIDVSFNDLKEDEQIKTSYPSKILVRSLEENNPFQMILTSKEMVDKRDLLEGLNPFLAWLIKLLISKPAYYGILADATTKLADKEITGTALYEVMSFRNKY